MIGLIMFAVALVLLIVGFPVAFTFGGVAVFFGLLAEGPEIFSLMPHRIWSIMNNTILMAIPLFIFMGIVLQKSNLAERLLARFAEPVVVEGGRIDQRTSIGIALGEEWTAYLRAFDTFDKSAVDEAVVMITPGYHANYYSTSEITFELRCNQLLVEHKYFSKNVPEEMDLHKPHIDNIVLTCPACSGEMKRVPEVIDVWFDSGAMPFAQ